MGIKGGSAIYPCQITISVSQEVFESLERLSKEFNVPRNRLINVLIKQGFCHSNDRTLRSMLEKEMNKV